MGSLFKSPKAPTVTAAPSAVVTPAVPAATAVVASEPAPTDAEIQTEAREQSLLRRNRGRLGTINTGFTGFLGTVDGNSSSKTLLGA